MRRIVIAAWLAATSLAATAPAVAESLITLPPLAPGEVLLETGGSALIRTPANRATLTVSISLSGKTAGEAEQAMDAALGRVRAAARAAGARAEDITVISRNSEDLAMTGNATMDLNVSMDIDLALGRHMAEGDGEHIVVTRLQIILDQPRNAPSLSAALDRIDGAGVEETIYTLADRRPARRIARAQAIEHARADAEAYAAAMNMRVVRVLRVTDREETEGAALGMLEDPDIRTASMVDLVRGGSSNSQVSVIAAVGVDYALAPR